MAYELYSHMLKHIYWGSYTIAKYSVDDEKQTVNIVHKVETSLTIISYYRSWGILLGSWYEEKYNA